jgi:hypothetical protein
MLQLARKMPAHEQKNQSLTDLLQAKTKTVQGRKFYHTRTLCGALEAFLKSTNS